MVAGIDGALITLGDDVEGNRPGNARPEPWGEPSGPQGLMMVVEVFVSTGPAGFFRRPDIGHVFDTPPGGEGHLFAGRNEVANVMKQGGDHQIVSERTIPGQGGGLEGMLPLAGDFAEMLITKVAEEVDHLTDDVVGRAHPGHPFANGATGPVSMVLRRDSNHPPGNFNKARP